MSTAVAVFHGAFGRVCLYAMDRPMAPHGHSEGHLIFHVDGPPGRVEVGSGAWPLSPGQAVAISPWQAHRYVPLRAGAPVLALVLYIRPAWFLDAARRATASLSFGRPGIEVTDHLARLVSGTVRAMLGDEREDRLVEDRLGTLTRSAFDQSWQWTPRGDAFIGPGPPRNDFRIRRAVALIREAVGEGMDVSGIAREVGLSRPHFFKLFRLQVGLTPNLYMNAIRMERAIDRLAATRETVSEIGFDLGFSSQASFSRFFISNGVVPPSEYRRSVHVAAAH